MLEVWLAQAGSETAEKAKEIFTDITQLKIIKAALVISFSYFSLSLVNNIVIWLSESVALRFRLKVKQALPFLRAFLLSIAVFVISNLFLDLSLSNVIAVTGTIAVALGFAFKDYVSSVIAGVIALFESPYQVGDRIKIGDDYGEIISYGLRAIRIQTPDDNTVSIPHNKIWTEAISNANQGEIEAQTIADFYFAHDVDADWVIQTLYRVAQTSKYTQLSLPILVIMEEKPWGTHFKLKCYPMDARDEFIYKTDLVKRAKQVFARAKISYPSLAAQVFESQSLSSQGRSPSPLK
ncbi:MAG TPA: mechanosensitive ion channel family protein [Oscillatoriales cyanobacterium M59_W2019_021]|nr:MAG: mechanosensitive ion channel family protein [Cyanobacteria bacterium J055]HIK33632.1 mechanosensitive ion channel family protein [Oscillatoriales cyanobacterium M4454_W2019_049]HIK50076.1 mechanosensitive ion channel family protein [Oscillatoriales cyanobacterium M59_W2019_021]